MYVFSKNIKYIKTFLVKFSIFTVEKNLCILHEHVFVMYIVLVESDTVFLHDCQYSFPPLFLEWDFRSDCPIS